MDTCTRIVGVILALYAGLAIFRGRISLTDDDGHDVSGKAVSILAGDFHNPGAGSDPWI